MYQSAKHKYRPFQRPRVEARSWPQRVIERAPTWLSTDLRDGNQAIIEPMDPAQKRRLWEMLLRIGFKEIEVGFPSASQADFDFVRMLIEEDLIPADVTIQVLTPAREPLVRRTFEAVRGARRAIVHLYNATAPIFRRVVFQQDRAGVVAMAVGAMSLMRELAAAQPETEWRFEYSPEAFSQTELAFAKEICDAVVEAAGATARQRLILNLPATVEAATPNVFADQVEWMHRHLARREAVIISVHPHNDRGTAVAATELALLAGAERVEGCLFGNGERTGNVCLVTLALNLYTQGIDPCLDFGDIDAVRGCAEACTGLPVHPRHPYAGDLVYTAFSGSHQDAIRKGFAAQAPDAPWEIPYLPIDPADVGRDYQAVIRVNSQSGKGGIAFLLEREYGMNLPRRLQIEFSQVVQALTDASGKEVNAGEIYAALNAEYVEAQGPWRYRGHHLNEDDGARGRVQIAVDLDGEGGRRSVRGSGNGPIDAFVAALGADVTVLDYHEHAVGSGADASAVAYVEIRVGQGPARWGIGVDPNIVTASLKAIVSGMNRCDACATGIAAPRLAVG